MTGRRRRELGATGDSEPVNEQAWDYGQPSLSFPSLGRDTQGRLQSWGSIIGHDEQGLLSISVSSQSTSNLTTPTASQSSEESFLSLDSIGSYSQSSNPFSISSALRKYTAHHVQFEDILRMVNDSLPIVFCDRRPRKSGGIILSCDTGFPRLDTVSPALFSPGYLEVRSTTNQTSPDPKHS